MKVGIIGLPQTGKKTLFQVLTAKEVREQGGPPRPVPGTADILDPRFDRMVEMYHPRKEVRARVDLVLLPKIEQESIQKGEIFKDIVDTEAVCHVVRAFEDEAVYHAEGSVDPLRDAEMVASELVMHDQMFVEKRIERIEKLQAKKADKDQAIELELMRKMGEHLESERPLRLLELSEEEEAIIRSYPFITRKEMILVLNVSEDSLADQSLLEKFAPMCERDRVQVMQVSAKVESEIALLESEAERQEFLDAVGIEETAVGVLARHCLDALGLISFLTVGEDEVRQWLVRRGSPAPVAAGVIHSDLQRGFIRAEVMKYQELVELGSEAEVKKAGKFGVEGKDYIVQDGDILNIRFKV